MTPTLCPRRGSDRTKHDALCHIDSLASESRDAVVSCSARRYVPLALQRVRVVVSCSARSRPGDFIVPAPFSLSTTTRTSGHCRCCSNDCQFALYALHRRTAPAVSPLRHQPHLPTNISFQSSDLSASTSATAHCAPSPLLHTVRSRQGAPPTATTIQTIPSAPLQWPHRIFGRAQPPVAAPLRRVPGPSSLLPTHRAPRGPVDHDTRRAPAPLLRVRCAHLWLPQVRHLWSPSTCTSTSCLRISAPILPPSAP